MEFKGTKGEWVLNGNGTMVFAGETHIVSYPVGMSKEQLNDIKLIAAPKLLYALQEAITGLEWHRDNDEKINPAPFDKADDEKLEEWKELIKQAL